MIKFENTDVWGFEHAIRGVRNPLNSWDRSDSYVDSYRDDEFNYVIGPDDLKLCQKLIGGGPEHRKFMRQIMVSVDITAPLYWWKEFDTYKVGTVANSCSTMHTIHKKEFTLEDFSCEHLDFYNPEEPNDDTSKYSGYFSTDLLTDIVDALNNYRKLYLETNDKKYWWQIIQILPTSYNQKRTVTLNYENLRSIYFQRKGHKLDEWRVGFIEWIKELPYAKEFIIFDSKDDKAPESLGEQILRALK